MKQRVYRNWKLVRASWMILIRYRMLLVYPLFSAIAVSVVAGYLPLALVRARLAEQHGMFSVTPQGVFGFLMLYFATCITVQVFDAMLVAATVERLDATTRPRLGAWRVPANRFPAIAAYAVLSSNIVSIPVEVIRRLARIVGIRSLPQPGAWSLGTFLGVPVIAVEGLEARSAMRRSEALLRLIWSDQFVGGVGVLIARRSLLVFAFTGGLGLLYLVTLIDYDPLSFATAVMWLATIVFLCITGSAVSTIHCLATYRHCIGRPVPGFEALYDIPGAIPSDAMPQEAVHTGTLSP